MNISPHNRKYSVLSLPNEILYEIVCYLNQSHLLQVMLVNRILHTISVRKLYGYIYVQTSSVRRLAVRDYVETPLHLKYTIIDGREKLMSLLRQKSLLPFVHEILFQGDDSGIAMGLLRLFRETLTWVDVVLNYNSMGEVNSEETYLYRNLVLIRDNQFLFEEDNDSIESLTILPPSATQDYPGDLSFIYRLKSLRKLKLTIQTKDTLRLFKSKLPKKLNIEELSLVFQNLNGICLTSLNNLFNLSTVTSLYIRIPQGYYTSLPSFVVPELSRVLSQTTNLRHFGLSNSAPINYVKLMGTLKKNSLNSLFLEPWYGHDFKHSSRIFLKLVREQQSSLVRVFYGKNYNAQGLEVFEETYRCDYDLHRLDRLLDGLKRELVERNRFPNLKQVVFDQSHYFIVRDDKGRVDFRVIS
ncbi:hypothetical protein JA1_001607 [Spathaspora sp. JA1]|nr:hypothetical protein JA1_001607 [Spathaspora sp. JA1]